MPIEFVPFSVLANQNTSQLAHEVFFLWQMIGKRGFIAGGFATELLGRGKAGDIDVWPSSVDNFYELEDLFYEKDYILRHESALAVTFQPSQTWEGDVPYRKVQLIKFDPNLPLSSPERLMLYFDVSVVQFVLTSVETVVQMPMSTMELHFLTTPQSIQDTSRNRVTITRMGNPIIRMIRLAKYAAKGFHITQKTWAETAAAIANCDPNLLQRTLNFLNGESEDRMEDERNLRDGVNTLAPDVQDMWRKYESEEHFDDVSDQND